MKNKNNQYLSNLLSKDDKDVELIPISSLQELYDTGCEKIEGSLNTSVLLHNSSKYSESVLFSIIIIEELYKLDQIREHIKLNKGFTLEEWKKITDGASHTVKLTGMYRDGLKNAKSIGKENYENAIKDYNKLSKHPMNVDYENDVSKTNHQVFGQLVKFNEIKKSILYFDWDKQNTKPLSFS